jgi:predicted PurR-regulated permease PerM
LPAWVEALEATAERLAGRLGADVDLGVNGEAVTSWLAGEEGRRTVLRSAQGVGSAAGSIAQTTLLVLAGVVLGCYVTADLPRLRRAVFARIPAERREAWLDTTREVGGVVGAFLRGQLLAAAFVGTATTVALWAIDLPLWLFVGVVAGVTNLVPFVGPLVGGVLAVGIAFLSGSPGQALAAGIAIFIGQQVESYLVAPLVVGHVVRLHPVMVMLAVLAGDMVAGLLGLLLGVPAAAALRVVFERALLGKQLVDRPRRDRGPAEVQPSLSVARQGPNGASRPLSAADPASRRSVERGRVGDQEAE